MINVSHLMLALSAFGFTVRSERYHGKLLYRHACEIDFETIVEVVFGAKCIIFAPASWCWPLPATAMDNVNTFSAFAF